MKKEVYIFSILVLILVILFFIFNNSEIKVKESYNYPPKNNTVVAFGDSLVEGFGSTDGGFVSDLEKQIGIEIINEGVSGNTTDDGLERIVDVLRHNPGVVLLLLGGNDYLRREGEDQTRENLSQIIEILQDDGILVILLGVRVGVLKDNFKNMYKDLSKEYKTVLVSNVLEGLVGNSELMEDIIHPNDLGYKIIADRIEPILREVLF
jgi:lysophospholipase L1-like esterase